MKKLFLIIAAALCLVSCHRTETKTIQAYDDGSPMLQQELQDSILTAETKYYENGKVQYSKHFDKNGKPNGVWTYNYPTGVKFAEATFSNENARPQWMIYNRDGEPYYQEQYDSLAVLEMGEFETPATIAYYKDNTILEFQFYSNGNLRSHGNLVDGKRQGVWIFYHPNGQKQTEADFLDGRENGYYTVYRETGVPFYRGQYANGQRIGTWEIYNEDATLHSTQNYD